MPRLAQIGPTQQHRQLLRTKDDRGFSGAPFRRATTSFGQFLRTYPDSAAVPDQQLQTALPRITKQEHVAAQQFAVQAAAHAIKQPFKLPLGPHGAGRQ